MVVNLGHIMMETVFPLCIQLGVKNIIINGWVGGRGYGIEVKNKIPGLWISHESQETLIKISEKMPDFF